MKQLTEKREAVIRHHLDHFFRHQLAKEYFQLQKVFTETEH